MEKNKFEIIKNIQKCVEDTFAELDIVNNSISIEKKKLLDLTIEYGNLLKEISLVKQGIQTDSSNLKRDRDSFDTEKASFKEAVSKFETNKASVEIELQTKILSRGKILEEIKTAEAKLLSLTSQVKAKELLTAELESISKLVVEKGDELKSLTEECIDTKKSTEKLKIDTANELQKTNEAIEAGKKVVFPTMQALEEREKKVLKREKDIEIIIERYKKLYADKGVNFRV